MQIALCSLKSSYQFIHWEGAQIFTNGYIEVFSKIMSTSVEKSRDILSEHVVNLVQSIVQEETKKFQKVVNDFVKTQLDLIRLVMYHQNCIQDLVNGKINQPKQRERQFNLELLAAVIQTGNKYADKLADDDVSIQASLDANGNHGEGTAPNDPMSNLQNVLCEYPAGQAQTPSPEAKTNSHNRNKLVIKDVKVIVKDDRIFSTKAAMNASTNVANNIAQMQYLCPNRSSTRVSRKVRLGSAQYICRPRIRDSLLNMKFPRLKTVRGRPPRPPTGSSLQNFPRKISDSDSIIANASVSQETTDKNGFMTVRPLSRDGESQCQDDENLEEACGDLGGTEGIDYPSFKELFYAFSRFGDPFAVGKQITLTNSDKWLKQAGVIDGELITTTDTSILFRRLFKAAKKIGFHDFVQYIYELALEKGLDVRFLEHKLMRCGPPSFSQITRPCHDKVIKRLTDVTKFTGAQRSRFHYHILHKLQTRSNKNDYDMNAGFSRTYQCPDTSRDPFQDTDFPEY
ncbi:unnamed protein product [Allacma fusca]|uniref:Uncharacterized protein n=1 Tax=Allacma fusca TaxID=39272 RepID=A0A8J2PQC2_9HEXA|nr:unnamed protein product [Allacma fusca]